MPPTPLDYEPDLNGPLIARPSEAEAIVNLKPPVQPVALFFHCLAPLFPLGGMAWIWLQKGAREIWTLDNVKLPVLACVFTFPGLLHFGEWRLGRSVLRVDAAGFTHYRRDYLGRPSQLQVAWHEVGDLVIERAVRQANLRRPCSLTIELLNRKPGQPKEVVPFVALYGRDSADIERVADELEHWRQKAADAGSA